MICFKFNNILEKFVDFSVITWLWTKINKIFIVLSQRVKAVAGFLFGDFAHPGES